MRILATTLLTMLLAMGTAQAQMKPGWIADPKTGCKVWNENPIPNEFITWSGPCVEGIANGNGTLQWYNNNKPGDR